MPIAVKMLEKVLTKRELELLRAESDLRNSATMEGLWQKYVSVPLDSCSACWIVRVVLNSLFRARYFTSAQLNISFPGEDITVSLGIFGKLHVDKKDHPSGLTVVIDVSHLYEGEFESRGARRGFAADSVCPYS